MAETATVLVEVCSYAGTGNVLKVQEMLAICSEHAVEPKKEEPNGEVPEEAEPVTTTTDAAPAAAAAADGEGDVAMGEAAPASPTEGASAEGETTEEEKPKEKSLRHQGVATIGIALVAMGEEVGAEMALRQFQHLASARSAVLLFHCSAVLRC
jgi:26S proteasome regulatory subunit N1